MNDYQLVPDDESADALIRSGGKPVIGHNSFSEYPDLFEKLVQEQWNSPQRIFAMDKGGQPRHFPWEDMVRQHLENRGEPASNDPNMFWNHAKIHPDFEPLYAHEDGAGYMPNELVSKYQHLDRMRQLQDIMQRAISP